MSRLLAVALLVLMSGACSTLTCGEGTVEVNGVCALDPDWFEEFHAFQFEQVATGDRHTCALDYDGRIVCWGRNDDGQSSQPDGRRWAFVDAGRTHSCAVDEDGEVECWGDSRNGELDAPAGPFESLGLGYTKSCGLRPDGSITCWGGQVGTPPSSSGFVEVILGRRLGCAMGSDAEVECWALSGWEPEPFEQPPAGPWKDFDVGEGSACGVTAGGEILCWGEDLDGRVSEAPTAGTFESVTVGHSHACALDSKNRLHCWGALDSPEEEWDAITYARGSWTGVDAGEGFHACGTWADGTVTCWGTNDNGQLDVPCTNPLDTFTGSGNQAR